MEKQREKKSEFKSLNKVHGKYAALEAKLLALKEKGSAIHSAWLRMFCLSLVEDPEADQSRLVSTLKTGDPSAGQSPRYGSRGYQ